MKNLTVYISYAHADRVLAQKLKSLLAAVGIDVSDPDDAYNPGDNYYKKLGEALERSDAIVFLLSPEAMGNILVQREIEYALSGDKFAHRLIPVVLRPTNDIPWILDEQSPIDLQSSGEALEDSLHMIVDRIQTIAGASCNAAN
jgi:hypothetical protein